MEEDIESGFFFEPSRPAPPPPPPTPTPTPNTTPTTTPLVSPRRHSNGGISSLPYAIPNILFHKTLNPRISNKHQELNRAKIKTALELELREDKLREAAGRGDDKSVINLLGTSPVPDINKPDDKGRTPLHFACAGGHVDTVKLLILHGANVNANKDVVGNRPLHLAVISNKLDCVVSLLEAGAKIDMDDAFHRTPLSVAQSRLSILMGDILMEKTTSSHAASVSASNFETAINLVIEGRDDSIVGEREIFRQVLQITKILRYYLALQSSEEKGNDTGVTTDDRNQMTDLLPSESSAQTIEELNSLTEQLSQLAMTENSDDSMNDFGDARNSVSQQGMPNANVLNRVQDVLDNLMKKQH